VEIAGGGMSKEIKVKLIENEDWDFKKADTKYMTHGLHPYPARMIPQIAKRLLERYAKANDVVLDPFCGSGGVLVEARLAGMHSVGIDINPLACLIAEVKSTPIDPKILSKHWTTLKAKIGMDIWLFKSRLRSEVEVPDFSGTNLEYWFKPSTIRELSIIRSHLMEIKDDLIRKFFDVAFSATIRQVSGVRKREYKLHRMPEVEWTKYDPDVFGTFRENVEKSIEKMKEFYNACDKNVSSKVFLADTRNLLTDMFPAEGNQLLLENPPKIIVTSPPYGDSRTTVAYGQFSRLSALWLNYEKGFDRRIIMNLDKLSLGGRPSNVHKLEGLETLNQTIALIERRDKNRAKEAMAFYCDLYECLKRIYAVLAYGGFCCIVIANRTISRIQVPTHVIIAEMGVDIGFANDIVIYPRRIPTKRLPWENAPENIPGLKGKTMSRENIIVLKKQD